MTVLEESRAIARVAQMKDHLLLYRVSWATYDALLDECAHRRLRHTYDRGKVEFMTRSPEHEEYKSLLGVFVVTLADVANLAFRMGGEQTLRREDLERGIEADQCFWIANEHRVRGKREFDLTNDPPPDLLIEVEVSETFLDRLAIAAALAIPEVWRFHDDTLEVGVLQPDGQYAWGSQSPIFPWLPMQEVVRFLQMGQASDHLTVVCAFRAWVQTQAPKP